MADFCLECTHEMFGDEFPSDFKGLLTQREFEKGYLLPVLCEGCGYIWVDHNGHKVERLVPGTYPANPKNEEDE